MIIIANVFILLFHKIMDNEIKFIVSIKVFYTLIFLQENIISFGVN